MNMSNYMGVAVVRSDTMAAKTPSVGINHLTVRPTNASSTDDQEATADDECSGQ